MVTPFAVLVQRSALAGDQTVLALTDLG